VRPFFSGHILKDGAATEAAATAVFVASTCGRAVIDAAAVSEGAIRKSAVGTIGKFVEHSLVARFDIKLHQFPEVTTTIRSGKDFINRCAVIDNVSR